jgi:hypothetical protein
MKIQINITETSKEVIVEESCNLKELATFMQVSFPDYYHEFKVVPKIIQNWGTPYVINPYIVPYWKQPYYYGYDTITVNTNGAINLSSSGGTHHIDLNNPSITRTLNKGTYNVEVLMRETQYNAGTDPYKEEPSTGDTYIYKKDKTET